MKLSKKCSLTVSAALVLSCAGIALGSPAYAAAVPVDPAISGDANAANGTVAFYNAAGAQVTSGGDLTHLFDYALGSADAPRAGTTKATLFFGFPDHTKPDSTTWFESQQSASTAFPNAAAPAGINATGRKPLVTLTSGDGNLQGLLSTTSQDTTTGYDHILQVRVYDSGPGFGNGRTAPFWATDISYDSVAGTWQQEYPAPPTLSAPGAPTAVSATPKDASADISWTAPVSDGGSAITKYTITATPTSGSPVTKDVTGATSGTITGLTNGTQYAVTVTATNNVGTSTASSPAVNVTPVAAPTAPAQVTGLTATAGDTSAALSWTAPSNGGSAITSYDVTYTPQGGSATTVDTGSTTASYDLTGLTNGTQYSVTVAAKNALGTGTASAAATVTPKAPTAPAAPTALAATPGNGQLTLTWTAPTDNGGSAITGYDVTYTPSGGSATTVDTGSTTAGYTLSGLTNGTSYSVTVAAKNAIGSGAASSTATATPATVPDAPTTVLTTPHDASADVSWTAPASNGGAEITKYTVTLTPTAGSPVTKDVTGAVSTTVTGLANGTTYQVTVTATNTAGTSAASSPAVAVTPVTTPSAPTGVTATPGNTQASISWTAPNNGGSAIEKYTVTLTPSVGDAIVKDVAGATSTVVTGLTNGTRYAVTVTATNAVGVGPASTGVNVTPGLTATSVSLALTNSVVTQGQLVTATGHLTGASNAGKTITLRFLMPGLTTVVRTATTNASGNFSYPFHPGFNTTVVASFAAEGSQAGSTSTGRGVVVRPLVRITSPSNGATTHARTITIKGTTTPNKAGTIVELLDARSGAVLVRARVASNGTFTFTRTFGAGTKVLKVHVAKSSTNAEGFSSNLTLHLV